MIKNNSQTLFQSPVTRSFIATALSSAPILSHTSVTIFFLCIIQALLAEIGMGVSPDKIIASYPRKDTLSRILSDEGANILSVV